MTYDDRLRLQIGALVMDLLAAQARIAELEAQLAKAAATTPP
jgi:hypothetical protein